MKRTKQILSVLLAALLIVLSVPMAAWAAPGVIAYSICGAEGDNVRWTLTDDRVLTISGTGAIEDDPVLYTVGNFLYHYVFDALDAAYEQDLLAALKDRGYNFSSVSEARSAASIVDNDFSWELFNEIQDSVPVDEDAYVSARKQFVSLLPRKLVIQDGITHIGKEAFLGETITGGDRHLDGIAGLFLSEVVLPSSLLSIGDSAFEGLPSLHSIQLPSQLRSIGDHAFWKVALRSLTIPASCVSIGSEAFSLTNSTTDLFMLNDSVELAPDAIQIPSFYSNEKLTESVLEDVYRFIVAFSTLSIGLCFLNVADKTETLNHVGMTEAEYITFIFSESLYPENGPDIICLFDPVPDNYVSIAIDAINNVLHTSFSSLDEVFTVKTETDEQGNVISIEPEATPAAESAILQWAQEYGLEAMFDESSEEDASTTFLGTAIGEGKAALPWFTVHGNPGSKAHQVAQASGVKFECLNHSYSSSVTAPATCLADGTRTYTCAGCGKAYTETIEKTGHAWSGWTKLNNAEHQRVCANDPTHKETAAHIWTDWETTLNPTLEAEGIKERRCQVCQAYEQETIERLELKDEETDISVIFNEWAAGDRGIHLVVKQEDPEKIKIPGVYNYSKVAAHEIFLTDKDGNEVQPKGDVKVVIPLPAGFNRNAIAVFHRHSTEPYEVEQVQNFRFEEENGTVYVVFYTDSFSTFIIVDTSSKTQPEPQPDPNMCHWCGKVHEGFFQKIIGFFHNIFAKLFGEKY